MKKTIIALFALIGVAMGEGYTFTTSNSIDITDGSLWGNGVALILDPDAVNSRLTTTVSPIGANMSDFTTVELKSITTNIRSLEGSSGIKLALTNSEGTILTMSDNVVKAAGDQTWTFSNTSVSTTDTLYFVYTAEENENAKVGYTLQVQNGGNRRGNVIKNSEGTVTHVDDLITCGLTRLANYRNTTGLSTLALLGSNHDQNFTPYSSQYAPYVSVVTSATVPEPATATLSLLALCGLAARRRRK